jgi:hypothetical protein
MVYHHPRFWRINTSDKWRAVGADNCALNVAVARVINRVYPYIQVKLTNAQIITVKPKP